MTLKLLIPKSLRAVTELMSAIQECIVELESALEAQESQGKSQKFPSVMKPVSPESAGSSQGHVSNVFTHAK